MIDSVPWAAVAPLIVLVLAVDAFLVWDILRRPPRRLPRAAWIVIALFASFPLGALAYLIWGRGPRPDDV